MIKLVVGVVLIGLFAYMFSLILKIRKVADKEKELADVIIDHEVANLDEEIQARREALEKRVAKRETKPLDLHFGDNIHDDTKN
jgi:hypothetical protein